MMSSAMSLAQCALGQFQYVNDEAGTLADSTCTAHCNNRDFGTSRWQISMNATRTCCGAGGRSWPLADSPVDDCRGSFRGDCVAKLGCIAGEVEPLVFAVAVIALCR